MKPEAFHQPAKLPSSARQTILIAGASGLIGTAFTRAAETQGHTVRRLVRRPPTSSAEFAWNPKAHTIDPDALEGVTAVLNLSGASISKMPWSTAYKSELMSSRIDATNTLVTAINGMDAPPLRLLSGSAVGIYGDHPDVDTLSESDTGSGFLAELCQAWEAAALTVNESTRVTLLRTGLVLSQDGGMLPVVTRIAKLGGAGRLGTGRQVWPWISVDDYCRALLHLLQSDLDGPVNMAAPASTSAAEFMRTLASVLKRPYLLPAPSFALRALLGDAANELLLSNQPAKPTRLESDGFQFGDTQLRPLLERLLG
jgi:uncharacterized protein (TIGR01777 family)